MNFSAFIGTVRKGNNTGSIEVTIPPKFCKVNEMKIGEDYIFEVKRIKKSE